MMAEDKEAEDLSGKKAIHSSLHTCTKGRQLDLHSCCDWVYFEHVIETYPLLDSNGKSILSFVLIMVRKMPLLILP